MPNAQSHGSTTVGALSITLDVFLLLQPGGGITAPTVYLLAPAVGGEIKECRVRPPREAKRRRTANNTCVHHSGRPSRGTANKNRAGVTVEDATHCSRDHGNGEN